MSSKVIAEQLFSSTDKQFVSNELFSTGKRHVLDKFVYLIDINENNTITECFHKLTEKITLPLEAQKLDTLSESYSKRLFELNKFHSKSSDGLYVLLYSMLMLKQDLSNTYLPKKILVDDFIRFNRGINEGEDFPKEFLTQIYNEMKLLYFIEPPPRRAYDDLIDEFTFDRKCCIL